MRAREVSSCRNVFSLKELFISGMAILQSQNKICRVKLKYLYNMEEPEKKTPKFLYTCLDCIEALFGKAKYTCRKYMCDTRNVLHTVEN